MKQAFIDRIKREYIVDTRKYRYRGWEAPTGEFIIQRVPVEYLDTTAAIDGWKTVYVEHNED